MLLALGAVMRQAVVHHFTAKDNLAVHSANKNIAAVCRTKSIKSVAQNIYRSKLCKRVASVTVHKILNIFRNDLRVG